MASWAAVARIAGELPDTQLTGENKVICAGQTLAWERPYTKADIKRETGIGAEIYEGTILAVHTPDAQTARAYVLMEPGKYFLTQHFADYPAVLCRLEVLCEDDLRELLFEARLTLVEDKGLG